MTGLTTNAKERWKIMFLEQLSDTNKERFVELAYKLAYSNRDFPESQQKLLGRFMKECGIKYVPNTTTREELIASFADQNEQVRLIVYYEIYMLLISDEEIDADETKVLGALRSAFGISEENAVKIQDQGMLLEQTRHDLEKLLGLE